MTNPFGFRFFLQPQNLSQHCNESLLSRRTNNFRFMNNSFWLVPHSQDSESFWWRSLCSAQAGPFPHFSNRENRRTLVLERILNEKGCLQINKVVCIRGGCSHPKARPPCILKSIHDTNVCLIVCTWIQKLPGASFCESVADFRYFLGTSGMLHKLCRENLGPLRMILTIRQHQRRQKSGWIGFGSVQSNSFITAAGLDQYIASPTRALPRTGRKYTWEMVKFLHLIKSIRFLHEDLTF